MGKSRIKSRLKKGCFVCGEEGHWAQNCEKKRKLKCFHCQKTGHMVWECPVKIAEIKCWRCRKKRALGEGV